VPTFDTAKNVLNDAALGMGILSSALSDPYASTDPNIVQLRTMLTELGQDLCRQHDWSQLQTEYTFPTVDGTASYALPTGFDRFINQTGWNRTTEFALGGPLGAQGWQFVQAVSTAGVIDTWFRIQNNLLFVHPTPGATVNTIAFEYVSKYWVALTGAPTTRVQETPTLQSDVCLFDRMLLIWGLRKEFLSSKGFDASHATKKYEDALSAARSEPAPVLSLQHKPLYRMRYLDGSNVPDTGFGE